MLPKPGRQELAYPESDDGFGAVPVYRTAQAAVAQGLREQILAGYLPPGTRVLQGEIAKRMRTSTTPVREAMRELTAEGLLDVDPHRGAIVHVLTSDELAEIYDMRTVLEPVEISRTVQRITEAELDVAERLLVEMESEDGIARWVVLNRDFHGLLSVAARSPLLTSVLNNLRNRSAPYVAMNLKVERTRSDVGNGEHRLLLDALRARDEQKAIDTVRLHLGSTVNMGAHYLSEA